MTLVESLRKYVGEQVPPEVHRQAWEPEREELLDTVQVGMGMAQEGGTGREAMLSPLTHPA